MHERAELKSLDRDNKRSTRAGRSSGSDGADREAALTSCALRVSGHASLVSGQIFELLLESRGCFQAFFELYGHFLQDIFRGKSGVAPRSHDLEITFRNYNRLHWHARLLSKTITFSTSTWHSYHLHQDIPICVRDCVAVNDQLEERELKQQTSRVSENVNPQCPQRSHHPHLHQAHPHCHDQSL